MANNELTKIQKFFFKDSATRQEHLTERQQAKIRRYETVFTFWMDNPAMSESAIAQHLRSDHGVSPSQSYREVADIKFLLGNVNQAAKEWARYQANSIIMTGLKKAEDAKDSLDVKIAEIYIRAGKAMADVHRLNKMEMEELPFDEIATPNLEPVWDPSLIGSDKSKEEIEAQRLRLRKKYGDIQDAQIVDDGKG